jgi:hypothetical protein
MTGWKVVRFFNRRPIVIIVGLNADLREGSIYQIASRNDCLSKIFSEGTTRTPACGFARPNIIADLTRGFCARMRSGNIISIVRKNMSGAPIGPGLVFSPFWDGKSLVFKGYNEVTDAYRVHDLVVWTVKNGQNMYQRLYFRPSNASIWSIQFRIFRVSLNDISCITHRYTINLTAPENVWRIPT